MTSKKQIRLAMKQKRAKLSLEEVTGRSSQISSQISDLSIFKMAKTICVYSPIGNEVDTAPIVQVAMQNNKQVAYPKTDTTTMTMEFYKVNHISELTLVQSGSFSLREPLPKPNMKVIPDENTLMIVPGLAFDRQFYRTGYGGGFYDKYLTQHPSLATIGVCYDFQLIPSAYPNQYDKAVGGIITPTRYIRQQ